MVRIRVDLFTLISIPRHNLNPTHDIMFSNFWHDLWPPHESNTKLEGYGWGLWHVQLNGSGYGLLVYNGGAMILI
jgi:hypothetical protein